MTAQYTVTFADFKDSMRGYRKVVRRGELAHYLFLWFLPIISLGTCAFLLLQAYSGGAHAGELFDLALLTGGLSMLSPLNYHARLKKAFRLRTSVTDGGRVVLSFDDREIVFALPTKTEVRYAWSTITNFAETKDTFTVFIQQAAFHTIPKRDLSEKTSDDLRNTIAANGIPSC